MVGLAFAQQFPSPYQRGPYNTTYVHFASLLTVGLEENLDIWLPNEPGTYQVFYFLDGFGGVIPGVAYNQVVCVRELTECVCVHQIRQNTPFTSSFILSVNQFMQVMDHIASHGVAVVVPWELASPLNPEDKVPIFVSVMDWAEGHLESKLHHKGVNEDVHLDLDNLAGAYGTHEFYVYRCPITGILRNLVN